jgi:hypothetical protein
MRRIRQLLIAVAETDHTFELSDVRGERMWVGRCIHCKRRLTVPLSGRQHGSAALEHMTVCARATPRSSRWWSSSARANSALPSLTFGCDVRSTVRPGVN